MIPWISVSKRRLALWRSWLRSRCNGKGFNV
jgi:hypothetical protein